MYTKNISKSKFTKNKQTRESFVSAECSENFSKSKYCTQAGRIKCTQIGKIIVTSIARTLTVPTLL